MSAYILVKGEVPDRRRFAVYQQLASASGEKFGEKFLVRGGAVVELEGSWHAPRMVVLEFPSLEQATSWTHSPEYSEAIEARGGAATFTMIALAGITFNLDSSS